MKKYMVYIRMQNIHNDEVQEIMVMNVESTSCAGAEHKILDNCPCIDNALAYDTEDEGAMTYALPYLTKSRCYDIKDFMARYRKMENARQEAIDEVLDEIEEVKEEIKTKRVELNELEQKVAMLKASIKEDNDYIAERKADLDDYCKKAQGESKKNKIKICDRHSIRKQADPRRQARGRKNEVSYGSYSVQSRRFRDSDLQRLRNKNMGAKRSLR